MRGLPAVASVSTRPRATRRDDKRLQPLKDLGGHPQSKPQETASHPLCFSKRRSLDLELSAFHQRFESLTSSKLSASATLPL
jgi:hypothetical protein